MITLAITAILIIIPIKYVLLSFSIAKPKTLEEYHTAAHKIKPRHFIDSSVAYGLQVAALTLFATWGYQYGIWVIWVPLFWMAGYIVLGSIIKKGFLDDVIIPQQSDTIHGFIGKRLSPSLTYLASIISLVAIIGTGMYEADFAGSFSSDLLFAATGHDVSEQVKHNLKIVLFASFVFVAASYMILAGYKAIVYTDRVQMFIGLIAFSGVVSLLAVRNAQNGFKALSLMLLILNFIALIILCFYWHRQKIPGSLQIGPFRTSGALLVLFGVFITALLVTSSSGYNNPVFQATNAVQFSAPFGFGFALIVNLFVANTFYQLVDVGQYQRLISVETNRDNIADTRSILARSNLTIGVYSAYSWFLVIIFGILLKAYFHGVEVNVYSIVAHFGVSLLQGNFLDIAMLLLLLLSVLSLMFSSLDSYIAGISFTADTDIVSKFVKSKTLLRPRLITGLIMFAGFVIISYLFPHLKSKYGFEYAAEFLYLCWAFQISLLPLVVGAFIRLKLRAWMYHLSVFTGLVSAFVPFLIDAYSVYQFSAWFAALGSMGMFGFWALICAKSNREKSVNHD